MDNEPDRIWNKDAVIDTGYDSFPKRMPAIQERSDRASLNRPAHSSVHTISANIVFLNMLIFYILCKVPHGIFHPQRLSLHPNNVCSSEEYS